MLYIFRNTIKVLVKLVPFWLLKTVTITNIIKDNVVHLLKNTNYQQMYEIMFNALAIVEI